MKLLFLLNEADYFLSHRLPVALAAQQAGYAVHVAAPVNLLAQEKIEACGFTFHPVLISRKGLAPWREAYSLYSIYRLYRKLCPDFVHLLTIKPVLYGSIAARLAGVPAVVAAITGMGYVQTAQGWQACCLRAIVRCLYRAAFGHGNLRVIFQNPDDRSVLLGMKLIQPEQAVLIRGSGVDMAVFHPVPETGGTPLVMLASRLLWDKGVGEFVAAAEHLQAQGLKARFVLVGDSDPGNPAAILVEQLEAWQRAGFVEWWGRRDDMPGVLAQAHVVCLPSYGEGLPKVLIEAAACAKPLVATDAPGCREIVQNGVNGSLVPVKDTAALAKALRRLIENPDLRKEMGLRSRDLAVAEFAVDRVIAETLHVYRNLQIAKSG